MQQTLSDASGGAADAEIKEAYAMVATSGAWFGGGLPARSCMFYRIPSSNIPSSAKGGLANWTAWGEGGPTLYRAPNATQGGGIDMETNLVFDELEIDGDFFQGDIVLPMLAGAGGEPLPKSAIEISHGGRGFKIAQASKVLQAQAYLNTHEPKELF